MPGVPVGSCIDDLLVASERCGETEGDESDA
jgi:hypothetical protein